MGEVTVIRGKLNRALHAEAAKRGLDHEALRDKASGMFAVASLKDLSDEQLAAVYGSLTGHGFRPARRKVLDPARRRAMGTAGTKRADPDAPVEMVTADDIERLGDLKTVLGWGDEGFKNFVRRQLKGKDRILTLADYNKVWLGMVSQARRKGVWGRRASGAGHRESGGAQ